VHNLGFYFESFSDFIIRVLSISNFPMFYQVSSNEDMTNRTEGVSIREAQRLW